MGIVARPAESVSSNHGCFMRVKNCYFLMYNKLCKWVFLYFLSDVSVCETNRGT